MASKSEFREWQQNFVTEAFYEAVELLYTNVKDEHCSPFADSSQDGFRRGYLQALRDITNIDIEEESPNE